MRPGAQGTPGADPLELPRAIAAARRSQVQPKAFPNMKFEMSVRSRLRGTGLPPHLEGEATQGARGARRQGRSERIKSQARFLPLEAVTLLPCEAMPPLGPAPRETRSPLPVRAAPQK